MITTITSNNLISTPLSIISLRSVSDFASKYYLSIPLEYFLHFAVAGTIFLLFHYILKGKKLSSISFKLTLILILLKETFDLYFWFIRDKLPVIPLTSHLLSSSFDIIFSLLGVWIIYVIMSCTVFLFKRNRI